MELDWIRDSVQTPWQEVLDWEKQCVESLTVRARACGLCGLFQTGFDRDREADLRATKPHRRGAQKRGRDGDGTLVEEVVQVKDNWRGMLLGDLTDEELEQTMKLANALPHYDRFIWKIRPGTMWRCSKCRRPGNAGSNARFVPGWSEEYVKLLIDMPYVWVHSLGFLDLNFEMQDEVAGYAHGNWGERSLVQGPLLQLQTAATEEQPFPVSMNAVAQHLQAYHPLYQCLVPLYQQPRAGDRVMIPPAAWMHIIRCQRNRNPLARTHEGLDLDTVLIAKLKRPSRLRQAVEGRAKAGTLLVISGQELKTRCVDGDPRLVVEDLHEHVDIGLSADQLREALRVDRGDELEAEQDAAGMHQAMMRHLSCDARNMRLASEDTTHAGPMDVVEDGDASDVDSEATVSDAGEEPVDVFALTHNLSVEATLCSPFFPIHDGFYEPIAGGPGTSFSLVDYIKYRCNCFLTPFTFHHRGTPTSSSCARWRSL